MTVKVLNSNNEYVRCECGNIEYILDNSTSDTFLYCSKCDKEYIEINTLIKFYGNCPHCNKFITTDGLINTLLLDGDHGKCVYCEKRFKIEY